MEEREGFDEMRDNKTKKILYIGLAIILIFILVFIVLKVVNSQKNKCSIDSDCTFTTLSCCQGCGSGNPVNKNYLSSIKFEKSIKCLGSNTYCPMVDCDRISINTPSCNENKICVSKVDCDATCLMWKERLENYKDDDKNETYQSILKQTGCQC
ncbi:hypothetical protein COU57_02740 [Candidatus Pacearchaeota archaeon CG10_big_fil_rev_8_21_14_0_10_32_14]|nr:MAG: hypothetical protein COU57_02740 [Candidatus Pacearchaeota archaeon CG10_big_fil_rev_8_21_14_0_10_32_14]